MQFRFFVVPLCTLLALTTVACSNSTVTAKGKDQKAVAVDSPADAFNAGKLKFEIRGLQNQATEKSYGAKAYHHTAMVVATGDPQYTKGTYMLMLSVKRLAGGDPESPRQGDDMSEVIIRDGIGRLEIYGGYRTSNEKWEAERIEVRPIALFNGVTFNAEPVQEN